MKVAVIGAGRMGRRHMQVVKNLGLNLSAICDVSQASLREAGNEFGVSGEGQFESAQQMFEKARPDCTIVATTAPSHAEYVCLAAESGSSHILCEKPMATSLADCERMTAVCAERGVKLAVNHQMRFMDQYRFPKKLVESEEFGGLASVNVIAGNFGMAMNGSHYFEMFRYMTDEFPDEITAWFSDEKLPNPRGPQYTDVAGSIRIVTKKGRRFYMDIGTDQGHGMNVIYACRNGNIIVDELAGNMHVAFRNSEHRSLPTTRYGMPFTQRSERIEPADAIEPTRRVLEALLQGGPFPDAAIGMMAVRTLVAAFASAENGHRPVKYDHPLPRDRVFPWA